MRAGRRRTRDWLSLLPAALAALQPSVGGAPARPGSRLGRASDAVMKWPWQSFPHSGATLMHSFTAIDCTVRREHQHRSPASEVCAGSSLVGRARSTLRARTRRPTGDCSALARPGGEDTSAGRGPRPLWGSSSARRGGRGTARGCKRYCTEIPGGCIEGRAALKRQWRRPSLGGRWPNSGARAAAGRAKRPPSPAVAATAGINDSGRRRRCPGCCPVRLQSNSWRAPKAARGRTIDRQRRCVLSSATPTGGAPERR